MLNQKKFQLKIGTFCLHISQIFLYLMASTILFTATCFFFGITINAFTLPLSYGIAIICLIFFYNDSINSVLFYEILTATVILGVLIWISGSIYDNSVDGNLYHKLAIGLLKNNWNPLSQLPQEQYFKVIAMNDSSQIPSGSLWAETYCKGTWIFAAGIYALTGNIESGKVYTLLAMVCAFLITIAFLTAKGKRMSFCILFSLAAMLSPIAIPQFGTYYVDGFLHLMLYILIISLIMQDQETIFPSKVSWSLIVSSMIICGNIKFTGLLYGGIFCIAYFLWFCFKRLKMSNGNFNISLCLKRMIPFAVLAFITIFWAGNTSYVTNFLRYHNFTYPLSGKGAVDIMTTNSPFAEVNHFKNFFLSIFSKMNNMMGETAWNNPDSCTLKFPFTVDWVQESQYLSSPDSRISGFGIFFSGILLISLIIIAVKLIFMKKDFKFYFLCMNLIVCLGLTFGITESWWARYSPYVYFIVLIALYIILNSHKKIMHVIGYCFAVIIILNASLFFRSVPQYIQMTKQVHSAFTFLQKDASVSLYAGDFSGIYFNLNDLGIRYVVDPEISQDPEAIRLGYLDLMSVPEI